MMNEKVQTMLQNGAIIKEGTYWEVTRSFVASMALILIDYFAVLAGVWTAYIVRGNVFPPFFQDFIEVPPVYLYLMIPVAFLFFLHFDRLHIRKLYLWQQAEQLFKASVYAILLIVVILYFYGSAHQISRLFIFFTWIFSFMYLLIGRHLLKRIILAFDIFKVPVIIIGAGKTAELLLGSFENNMSAGYRVVGFIEDKPNLKMVHSKYRMLGHFDQAEEIISREQVKNIIIAAPGLKRSKLVNLVYRLQPQTDNITIVPDLFGLPVGSMELETLFHEKTVLLKVRNNLSVFGNRFLKQLFERVIGTFVCLLIVPIMLVIAIIIKCDSKGSPFYLGKRMGKHGELFTCYKFRTMREDGEQILQSYLRTCPEAKQEWECFAKLKTHDPRVTRAGKWLRKYSLDELPQIINVIKGEMSLVGPRPYLESEAERMGIYKDTILMTTPGVTGLWQVSGRNEINFEDRLSLDCWYVRNWSLWLDIVLLMKTIKVVISRDGAY
ncbi:undecaprenyl-phosphate galactose phosphotransferase WbaP [Sporomusa sphaeroides DSM 2875]|uniref:undecaprenyl-phosphate galactose phosphotransferase WbaP n=1 Tax=Sporomusa sphaeroides TaxID=47679 RepID=UPI00202E2A41|nr:undecaprenyl-phosphate galactose phosphotransferase WbaP [Sporomusa sphaeroides]MCM0758020.1 undecaprenyl-phosphate galactose phosphotransferase WbaP [Sporomusa sphaeroides DSM 2875]